MQVQKFSTLPYTRPDYAAAQQKLRKLNTPLTMPR